MAHFAQQMVDVHADLAMTLSPSCTPFGVPECMRGPLPLILCLLYILLVGDVRRPLWSTWLRLQLAEAAIC